MNQLSFYYDCLRFHRQEFFYNYVEQKVEAEPSRHYQKSFRPALQAAIDSAISEQQNASALESLNNRVNALSNSHWEATRPEERTKEKLLTKEFKAVLLSNEELKRLSENLYQAIKGQLIFAPPGTPPNDVVSLIELATTIPYSCGIAQLIGVPAIIFCIFKAAIQWLLADGTPLEKERAYRSLRYAGFFALTLIPIIGAIAAHKLGLHAPWWD